LAVAFTSDMEAAVIGEPSIKCAVNVTDAGPLFTSTLDGL